MPARVAMRITLGCVVIVVVVTLIWQVRIGADDSTARSCGSAFDVLADRTNWEAWWALDLAEPDPAIRERLPRTTACPAALNRRIVAVAIVAGLGVAASVALIRTREVDGSPGSERTQRLVRLGRVSVMVGASLTSAGAAALVLLVADADSTLFIHVDRWVVAAIGSVSLAPTLVLVVAGRALMVAAQMWSDAIGGGGDSDAST